MVNTFGVRLVGVVNRVSVWWHLTGVVVIVGALTLVPARHRSPQSYDGALHGPTGVPPAQVFIDAVGETGGKPR